MQNLINRLESIRNEAILTEEQHQSIIEAQTMLKFLEDFQGKNKGMVVEMSIDDYHLFRVLKSFKQFCIKENIEI